MTPASVPADDRGLLLGDGLFETILAVDGGLEHFEAHLARMTHGCAAIGIAPPGAKDARVAAERALGEAGLRHGRAAVRLTLTAGSGRGLERPAAGQGRLIASASPTNPPPGPATLRTATIRRNETSPASRLKTLSYLDNILARREARAAGADEALMLNGRGEIACAAAANVFWISGGRLFTPALECGVLAGIMRAEVVRTATALGVEVLDVAAAPGALEDIEGMFLTSSLIGVRPVARLDGRELPFSPLADTLSSRDRGSATPGGA